MKEITFILFCLLSQFVNAQNPIIDGDQFVCLNTNGNLMVINDTAYDSYQWYKKFAYDEDAVYELIPNATGPNFTFDLTYNEYLLKLVTTLNGTTYESNEILIDVLFDFGVAIEIIYDSEFVTFDENGIHVCEGHSIQLNVMGPLYTYSVQWYKNDVLLEGETNPTLIVSEPGFYHAVCARQECPLDFKFSMGDNVNYVVCNVSNKEEEYSNNVLVFPNPTSDFINISTNNLYVIDTISVVDMSGKEVLVKSISSTSTILDISSISEGVYFIITTSGGLNSKHKFVKK